MKVEKIEYNQIPMIASRDLSYINQSPDLQSFYKYPPHIDAFKQALHDKQLEQTNRHVLVQVLEQQHQSFAESPAVWKNIKALLSANTFTVTTAHQPSLFTGPLYYIFKIISTINLAEKLNDYYPEYHFVPVFISSGEDHDFAEVNHMHLFNKTLVWESGEKGPVGQMKTQSLASVLSDLKEVLGSSEHANHIFQLIEHLYTSNEQYDRATAAFVHELFKDYGLVVLNTNDSTLKRQFIPIIREEILQQPSFPIVNETIRQLEAAGFTSQATPREINFFYMIPQVRERIVWEEGRYKVLNTSLTFSRQEMEAEIENHPERFSPNVVMRPLYQETTLPNLAYIGGGGEIAYWLERKAQFGYFKVNFPILIRRNSALWIDTGSSKKMEKLGIAHSAIWESSEDLVKGYLRRNAGTAFHLDSEREVLEQAFRQVSQKAEVIDPTLVKTVWAEHAKALKSLEMVETRLVRSEKQKHETAIQQIRALKEKLFPDNGLQERHDNFLPLYLKYGKAFFEALKNNFDPLERKFVVIWE